MENGARAKLKALLAGGQASLEPLSFPQRELWEASAVPPGDASHNICCYIDIRGPLTRAMCAEALSLVVGRHDALRTTFLPGKEQAFQFVRASAEPVFTYRELSEDEAREENLPGAMAEGFGRPMDLLRGPLYRLEMLRRGPDHHAFAVAIHHAVADGWTMSNFVVDFITGFIIAWRNAGNDMSRVQHARSELPPLAMTYAQWAAAERAQWQPRALAEHADYWRRRLEGSGPVFADRGVGGGTGDHRVAQRRTFLPQDLHEVVRTLARDASATLFNTLLAVFRVALFRWAGAEDVVVGVPMAGRTKTAARDVMGYFSGIVPLRCRIDPARPFAEALRAVHAETVEDFARAMPFAELAAAVAGGQRPGRHPVFDVRFAMQNHPLPNINIPGIASRFRQVSSGTSRFDIACEITELGGALELVWLHRPSIVGEAEMGELDRLFHALLREIARNPRGSLSGLSV